jgi:hypothetical protein
MPAASATVAAAAVAPADLARAEAAKDLGNAALAKGVSLGRFSSVLLALQCSLEQLRTVLR